MHEIDVPAGQPGTTAPDEREGDFATGERLQPRPDEAEFHEGDFAAGERTRPELPDGDPEAGLHGDYAAGERTEPLEPEEGHEGTFADTTPA